MIKELLTREKDKAIVKSNHFLFGLVGMAYELLDCLASLTALAICELMLLLERVEVGLFLEVLVTAMLLMDLVK